MDYQYLAELLFPNVKETPEDIENRYPKRNLPEGAKVTRFAPSPTGFVHFGGLFPTRVGERLAHQSGGVFYLRIEDTDAKREVAGAKDGLIRTLAHYGIEFDEGAVIGGDKGDYGPYTQSKRAGIYHVFAKKLVSEGKAYPCFTTEEELKALEKVDKKAEIKAKDWHDAAEDYREVQMGWRSFTIEDVKAHLDAGHPFVLRMLADGDPDKKFKITDLIKGDLELPENDKDEVLLKSDGIPTYHFAHAVDDHLMGTTHVIRGEEWLPSLSRHIMLFRYLGFKAPKYMHIAQLMNIDENGAKKKLSKRDKGTNLDDYEKQGYAPEAINEYIMTLLNSNYEEWHSANPDKSFDEFPFNIKKMSTSGCLLDFGKLTDVSKNVLSRFSVEKIYGDTVAWAEKYDPDFAACLSADSDYTKRIFAIGRGGKKPRKDLTLFSDVKGYAGFFFDPYFDIVEPIDEKFSRADVRKTLSAFLETYSYTDDMNVWFDKVKAIAADLGYATDMKAYKADPTAYPGNVADVSSFIRVAVTGKQNSPDLYTVMQILGETKVRERIKKMLETL